MLAIVVPTLNVEDHLDALLAQVSPHAERVVISDGGSTDGTLQIAIRNGAVIAMGTPGRGQQLRRGATWAVEADWLLFLHADAQLSENWYAAVQSHIQHHPNKAGYFSLKFQSRAFAARSAEFFVRLRCRFWHLPYGDQGLLISKELYDAVGGYAEMALFEDVDLIQRLGPSRIRRMDAKVTTFARKHQQEGFFKRGFKNLRLLRRYNRGAPLDDLIRDYG